MLEQEIKINNEIKKLRDEMYETKLESIINPDENIRKAKQKEYNNLVMKMKKILTIKYEILGGERNDKYKGKWKVKYTKP